MPAWHAAVSAAMTLACTVTHVVPMYLSVTYMQLLLLHAYEWSASRRGLACNPALQILDIFAAVERLHDVSADSLRKSAAKAKSVGAPLVFSLSRGPNKPPFKVSPEAACYTANVEMSVHLLLTQ